MADTNVFVSFDHDDQQQVGGFRSLKSNPKHPLSFNDHSIKDAVTGRDGKPIKYGPNDSRSKPIRDEITKRFERCSKLVVLIGELTHKSEWVDWEVTTFFNMKKKLSGEKTWKRIRGMKLKGADEAKVPAVLGNRSTKHLKWDPEKLDSWIDNDPDA